MTFHEHWYQATQLIDLGLLVMSTADVPGRVIEVGCWEGRSTIEIATRAFPRTVDAVDTWQGSPGEVSGKIAPTRDVYATFRSNIAKKTRGNVRAYKLDWRDYFTVHTGPIGFLHIDAEHTYREVFDNIEAALPEMSPRGVICGDDAHHPPVMQAARDLLPGVTAKGSLWVWRNDGE